jgi:hypothetical protein
LQRFSEGVIGLAPAVEGDDEGEEQPKSHKKPEFRVPPHGQGLAPEKLEVQGEVNTPHEQDSLAKLKSGRSEGMLDFIDFGGWQLIRAWFEEEFLKR